MVGLVHKDALTWASEVVEVVNQILNNKHLVLSIGSNKSKTQLFDLKNFLLNYQFELE